MKRKIKELLKLHWTKSPTFRRQVVLLLVKRMKKKKQKKLRIATKS